LVPDGQKEPLPGILDLTDPAIAASFGVCDDGMVTTDGFAGGTIEILSIDESGVSFEVYGSHSDLVTGGFDGDGLYAASMCP
jgi:hypothetical protein